jgi:hypothetical protein
MLALDVTGAAAGSCGGRLGKVDAVKQISARIAGLTYHHYDDFFT